MLTRMDSQVDLDGAVVVLRRELLAEGHTDQQIRALVKGGPRPHPSRRPTDAALWRRLDPAGRHRLLIRTVLERAIRRPW